MPFLQKNRPRVFFLWPSKKQKFMQFNEKKAEKALLLAFGAAMLALAVFCSGTADDGDSVHHFLFARWAFDHPRCFFNHWAKPLFVLLAAPFAKIGGFTGVKILNAGLATASVGLTMRIAEFLGIEKKWRLPILAAGAVMFVTHSLSGLTEPLFAFWLAAGVFLMVRGERFWAYSWFSFLPFVRSEGLVVLCVLAVFALFQRDFRFLPLFLLGHVVYGLAGWPIHGTPFWVVGENPYATTEAVYGQGDWGYFFRKMPAIIGWPLVVLLVVGLLDGAKRLLFSGLFWRKSRERDETFLVYGIFLAFFVAHAMFWALGIFKSFGMLRVFVGVGPLIFLICLRGWNRLESFFKNEKMRLALGAVLIFSLPFEFDREIDFRHRFGLAATQKAQKMAAEQLRRDFPGRTDWTIYSDAPNVALEMDLDWFDSKRSRDGWQAVSGEPIRQGSVVFWDDWYTATEGGLPLAAIEKDARFRLAHSFEVREPWGTLRSAKLFYADSSRAWAEGEPYFRDALDTVPEADGGAIFLNEKCQKVGAGRDYSRGYRAGAGGFDSGEELLISFDAAQPEGQNPANAAFVWELECDFKVAVWRSQDFKNDLAASAGKWRRFEFRERVDEMIGDRKVLKAYVLSTGKEPIFIKNWKVERATTAR